MRKIVLVITLILALASLAVFPFFLTSPSLQPEARTRYYHDSAVQTAEGNDDEAELMRLLLGM